jgi:hypothetical protein
VVVRVTRGGRGQRWLVLRLVLRLRLRCASSRSRGRSGSPEAPAHGGDDLLELPQAAVQLLLAQVPHTDVALQGVHPKEEEEEEEEVDGEKVRK